MTLPPLPNNDGTGYTADQMREYAVAAANKERQFFIYILESMHERCLGTHNYYLFAANTIRDLPAIKPT